MTNQIVNRLALRQRRRGQINFDAFQERLKYRLRVPQNDRQHFS
jgi:hypothetical protein